MFAKVKRPLPIAVLLCNIVCSSTAVSKPFTIKETWKQSENTFSSDFQRISLGSSRAHRAPLGTRWGSSKLPHLSEVSVRLRLRMCKRSQWPFELAVWVLARNGDP